VAAGIASAVFAFIRGSALVILVFAFTACAGTTDFVLANDANEAIASATVELKGPIVELGPIEPGGRATGRLAVGGDADYHITIRFSQEECSRRDWAM
jgi:hypothetical protein